MSIAVATARTCLQLVTRGEAIPASITGTAVRREIVAGFARHAGAGLVVTGAVAKAVAAAGARDQLVARRVVVMGRQARAAVLRHVKPSVARITDTGLVVAGAMAIAISTAGAGLKLVARRIAIPAINT